MSEKEIIKDDKVWEGFCIYYTQCPICGKFTSKNEFWINGLDQIVEARGICKTHGKVDILNSSEWGFY